MGKPRFRMVGGQLLALETITPAGLRTTGKLRAGDAITRVKRKPLPPSTDRTGPARCSARAGETSQHKDHTSVSRGSSLNSETAREHPLSTTQVSAHRSEWARMRLLTAMQELAELAASYNAAYERSCASQAATLRLAAIVVVDPSVVPAKAGTQTQACSQCRGSERLADARSRGSSVLCWANDRRMDSPVRAGGRLSVRWNDGICGRE